MAYVDIKSFAEARAIPLSLNISARSSLLNELDFRMAAQFKRKSIAMANCPEHLYSTDDDKLAAARLANG